MNKIIITTLFICLLLAKASCAQSQDSTVSGLQVQMDEVTITAARTGWDVNAFIKRIKEDTSFYKSFRYIRLRNYTAKNDIRILHKNGGTKASLNSTTRQHYDGKCRTMTVEKEQHTGDFYTRKGTYEYYTAELFASLFFTQGAICGETDVVKGYLQESEGKGAIARNKEKLKQLIFNPGSKIEGIPFMGNKASVFDPEIAIQYDFKLLSVDYNGVECYLFTALPKTGQEGDVVFKKLSTWFRKSDYAIVARDYILSWNSFLYDFDVSMQVRLGEYDGKMMPSSIHYAGNWKVPMKKREDAVFNVVFEY